MTNEFVNTNNTVGVGLFEVIGLLVATVFGIGPLILILCD